MGNEVKKVFVSCKWLFCGCDSSGNFITFARKKRKKKARERRVTIHLGDIITSSQAFKNLHYNLIKKLCMTSVAIIFLDCPLSHPHNVYTWLLWQHNIYLHYTPHIWDPSYIHNQGRLHSWNPSTEIIIIRTIQY